MRLTRGFRIKTWLQTIFEEAPHLEEELHRTPAAIFDKMDPIIEDPDLRPPIRLLITQLEQWGMLSPVKGTTLTQLYHKLSADVHVVPDHTDIGRLSGKTADLFEPTVILASLQEYGLTLHRLMDIAVVVELNILRDFIDSSAVVQHQLRARLPVLRQLDLQRSRKKMEPSLRTKE